jgi:hypothetical protein
MLHQERVQDLALIAASSKSLKEACVAIARRDLLQLMEAAVAQAAEAEARCSAAAAKAAFVAVKTYKLQVHAVTWLLRAAPAASASDAAIDCVLSMPAVPEQAAVQLVTAGMRVSYAQLLSAADRMVKGVEVWVLAQHQLGVQTDIPEDAVDICRGESSVFTRWVSCHSARLAGCHAAGVNSMLHGIQ